VGNSRSIGVSRAVCPSRTARPFFGDGEGGERSCSAPLADLAAPAALVGESRSIEEILSDRRLRRSLGQVLYQYRIPVQDAEDLIQDVMLLAVSKWSGIRAPEAWLFGTLRNRCILYWRGRAQHDRRFEQLDDTAMQPASAPEQARWELLADLGAATRRLPATQRRLVILRCRLGLTPPEAAAAIGLAHGSVRSILNRGLARLREELGEPPRRPRARPRPADLRPVPTEWSAAVDVSLEASSLHWRTRRTYRDHLAAAGSALGGSPAELAPSDLAAYRAALLADGRALGTHLSVLLAVRSFLLWAGEHGLHAIPAESIRTELRGRQHGGRRRRATPDVAGGCGAPATATAGRDSGGGA
jgi:RNA polymerase sigma factor (sigma-70 family)